MFLNIHMIKNTIENKPLINPKIFSSISREDDFYTVLIKFAEDVTFFYNTEEEKKKSRTLNQDNLKNMYLHGMFFKYLSFVILITINILINLSIYIHIHNICYISNE